MFSTGDSVRVLRATGHGTLATAQLGRRAHWKKAVVTLKEGEKLDLV